MTGRLSRRDVLALVAASGGAGLAALAGTSRGLAAFVQTSLPPARPVAFSKGAVVRTLLKDVPPESLSGGPVLFHEHLSMHYPPQAKEHFTDDVSMMIDEGRAAGKDGISCDDPKADIAQQLAKRGAFVEFDRVTIPIVPDAERVVMIMAMVEAGYAGNVLLSSDFAVAGSLKKNGGAG